MDKPNKSLLFLLALIACAAGLYQYRPYGLYFLADDFIHIPESINNLWEQRNSLRPIGNISLHLDYLHSQTSAKGYHVTNLLLHAINTLLVFLLCRTLLSRYSNEGSKLWFPFLSSLLFFVYPFHSETVFWVIGRSGSLGVLFFLPALIFYLKKEKSVFFFIVSILFFELSLLAYESSWIFPLLVIAIAVIDARGKRVNPMKSILPIAIVLVVFILHLFLRSKFTGALFNNYDTGALLQLSIKDLALNGMRLLARTFLPPMEKVQSLVISLFVALMFITALIVKFYRHNQPKPLFALLTTAWIISYLPYLSLGIDTHGVEGERYLYMPSVFFCLWLIYVVGKIVNHQYQLAFSLVLVAASSFYLNQSRSYYVKAGAITKSTFDEIGKLTNAKEHIFINQLPQYYHGAVVFRLGLEEGLRWLHPNMRAKVVVNSIDDSDKVVKRKSNTAFVVKYENAGTPQDAYFNFTDTLLTIMR